MNKIIKRIISFVSILVLAISINVYATNTMNNDESAIEEDKIIIFDPDNVIDALTFEELQNNNCINRVPSLENDLYSVVYKCADGNTAEFIFQNPIKYVTDSGEIKDIDLSIDYSQENKYEIINEDSPTCLTNKYRYSSENNSFKIYYSDEINDFSPTIVAVNEKWKVGLSPRVEKNMYENISYKMNHKANSKNIYRKNSYDSIEYMGVFDNNVSLHYQTTYTGYKEMIEIKQPISCNEFKFEITVGELIPKINKGGELILTDPLTNNIVAKFAKLYVYDSSKEPLFTMNNSYKISPIDKKKGVYSITIVVDKDFFNNELINYPIIVDPTFSFNTVSSIDDAPIYSGKPSANHGMNYYNHIGYVDSSYGVGSLLVKFPSLKNSTLFNGLSDSRINSVRYNVRKAGGSNSVTSTLSAYRYLGPVWSESSVTYNSAAIHAFTGSLVSSVSMTNDSWYSFNITSVAKEWKNGNMNYDLGIIIKNTTNNNNVSYERVLASSEYGSFVDNNYMPYVSIIYNNGDISAAFSSAELAAKDFARSVYSSSEYLRMEYAATIYKYNGNYYYYNVHIGEPHNVVVSKSVPENATYVAYIHTHPNSEQFSEGDINVCEKFGGYAYVVTPSYSLKRYDSSTNAINSIYSGIVIHPLTEGEKSGLVGSYNYIWYNHIQNENCDFHCENKVWPNG